MGWSTTPGIWVGAIGTIALFSFVYRENKIYRLFEHIFIGLAAGYLIRTIWKDVLYKQWWTPMVYGGQWPWVFVLFLGALFYTMYSKKYNWMSRVSIGILLGLVSGQIFQQTINDYVPQIRSSFKPLYHVTPRPLSLETPLGTWLNNFIFIVIVLSVLVYFFFSFEQKNKVVAGTARFGRLMMMFGFGAIFGSTVMARMALVIDRSWFLMHDWLHIR